MQVFAVDFFLNFLPLGAERASNILVDKHFSDLLPKGAGNFEGQTQVGVKSALFNAVDGLARHTHPGGQLCLGPFPLRAQYTQASSE
jgi:hypothetical protein